MQQLIGIATWNYRDGSLASRIERFRNMGYNAVSLNSVDARALCSGATPDVEEAILEHSMALVCHAGLLNQDRELDGDLLIADFENLLSWNTGKNILRTINYDAAASRTEDGRQLYWADEMHDIISQMLELSQDAGFTVGIEDWPRNDEHLKAVADLQVYPHFGILIDLGHLNIRIRQGLDVEAPFPYDAARSYLDAITLPVNELHIHNNDGIKDRHAPLSMGNADFTALAAMLKNKGVRGVSTIEIAPTFCGISQDQAVTAAQEAFDFWSGLWS